ncbi:MAG: exonuclease [Gammaproteobacteria bacterium]|nr:exonuclease [Gammaproteobacteria bacterium]
MAGRKPMTKAVEIYISTDIEADGPIPGPYSMLSFASAAYSADKTLLSTYSANLETLPDAGTHSKTMEWWKQFPEAWAACRREPRAPEAVMREYLAWLQSLSGQLVFVGWPATWDFMWIYWYLVRFTGERPFREVALDVRSYAMGMRKSEFRQTSRTYLPKRWFDEGLPHTHVALDDAIEQGALFCNMLAENKTETG